jgi:hypothetical protein
MRKCIFPATRCRRAGSKTRDTALEVVHGLDHERKAVRRVVTAAGDEPDADGIPTRHKAIAVVLNLMNPIGTRGRTVGGGR